MNNSPLRVQLKTDADSRLIKKPILAPHFGFHAVDDTQVFLVSETVNTLLHGAVYPDLFPLLDGLRTFEDLVVCLDGKHAEASIRTALVTLAAKGYIVSSEHGMNSHAAAFWTSLGVSPKFAEERLSAARVHIAGDSGGLARQLKMKGVSVSSKATGSTLCVHVCSDYLDERHIELNRKHVQSDQPWMLLKPNGLQPLFGPVFGGDERAACWDCLAYRLRGHQEVHNFLRNLTEGGIDLAPRAASTAATAMIHSFAAVEIAKWIVLGKRALMHSHAVSMNVADVSIEHHRIMRRPQCQACGDEWLYKPDRQALPVTLQSSPKNIANSGGVRSVAPEATLERYRHLVGPVGGVVTWLRRTTRDADPWLHVYWAGSNIALKNRSMSVLRLSLRTKSAGKGSTAVQSEASALCEALERYCGAFHGDEIRRSMRFSDFPLASGEAAIHPNDVQLFSERQLDQAKQVNDSGHPYNVVPPRLAPDAQTDWTPVWSVTSERHLYLPTSLLYYGKSADHRGLTDFVADSNGCAAGNTLEEAILQGFYELVERDAFAVWWYNRLQMPGVDLDSFDDPYLDAAEEYYRALNRELWVLDVSSDLGIPTFVALSRRTDKESEDIIYGAGSHMDPRIAILRAVCELNQFLNWVQGTGSGGAGYQVDDPQCLSWWQSATVANHSYLLPDADAAPKRKNDYALIETDDVLEDLQRCRSLVEAKGMEFLVLDQTRPDIGMPVARVIVPGMRHYWERFAPGRLYDVAVDMGWRKKPLAESELNPSPVIG